MNRLLVLLLVAAACGDGKAKPDGGGPDAFIPDDAMHGPDGATLAWVDFSASGCTQAQTPAAIDGGAPTVTCSGAAALTATFTPLASGPIDTWAWTFGDGGTSSQATPTHIYVLPGSYDVTLSAAGPGGSATATRTAYIVVAPATLGAACSKDAQCTSASCACGDVACDAAASLCASACDPACTTGGGVCGAVGGAWDASLCLRACVDDSSCPTGRTCDVVATASGWVTACLPAGALAAIGASCAGPSGLDAGACASADCLGVGARGMCTVSCAGAAPCPDGTACATFGNGTAVCLPACDGSHPCGADPWLACEAPGASGAWGFTLPAAGTVCAPKSCSTPSECPAGACVAGHCTAS